MPLLLHQLFPTRVVPWDVKRFICRGLTCLLRQVLGAALRVGPGLSPGPTHAVALSSSPVRAPLFFNRPALRHPAVLSWLPVLGQRRLLLLCGRKVAQRWCAHLAACASGAWVIEQELHALMRLRPSQLLTRRRLRVPRLLQQ